MHGGLGLEEQRGIIKGHEATFGGNDIVAFLIVVMVSQVYPCVKTYQIVQLKLVQLL